MGASTLSATVQGYRFALCVPYRSAEVMVGRHVGTGCRTMSIELQMFNQE